jgi:hypothetical protein
MSEGIQLVTVIGDQIINVGNCHPSQARILEKKGHATWRDGKLVVQLRPVHLAVAINHNRLEREGFEVSNAELERRLDWLRDIVTATVASDTHGSDIDHIIGYSHTGYLSDAKNHTAGRLAAEEVQERLQAALRKLGADKVHGPLKKDEIEEQIAAFAEYHDTEDAPWFDIAQEPVETPEVHLKDLWEAAPDVREHFANPSQWPSSFPPPDISDGPPVYEESEWADNGIRLIPVAFVFKGFKPGTTLNRINAIRTEMGLGPVEIPPEEEQPALWGSALLESENEADEIE